MLVRDADVWTQYTVCYPPRRSELGAAEPPMDEVLAMRRAFYDALPLAQAAHGQGVCAAYPILCNNTLFDSYYPSEVPNPYRYISLGYKLVKSGHHTEPVAAAKLTYMRQESLAVEVILPSSSTHFQSRSCPAMWPVIYRCPQASRLIS